jgi:hypothetical protein
MSEALISSQNQRIVELQGEKGNLQRALKEARHLLKARAEELDKLRKETEGWAKERDQAIEKLRASPNEHAARMTELEAENNGLRHQVTFTTAALRAGAKPDSIEDLYKLSGLKPGMEPATVESFAEYLTQAKEARAWAFGVTPVPAGQQATPRSPLGATVPPAGSGRSASDAAAGKVYYTRRDVVEPNWQKTRPDLAAALKRNDGSAVLTE